jgi:hypothetical protein
MITDLIASATVATSGTISTIELTGIPSTYTDLVIFFSARVPSATPRPEFTLNTYAASDYIGRNLGSSGTSPTSSTASQTSVRLGLIAGSFEAATSFGNCVIQIPNYASSSQPKTIKAFSSFKDNSTTQEMNLDGRYVSGLTAAITSLQVTQGGNFFNANTTIYLYGTLKGSGGATVS